MLIVNVSLPLTTYLISLHKTASTCGVLRAKAPVVWFKTVHKCRNLRIQETFLWKIMFAAITLFTFLSHVMGRQFSTVEMLFQRGRGDDDYSLTAAVFSNTQKMLIGTQVKPTRFAFNQYILALCCCFFFHEKVYNNFT